MIKTLLTVALALAAGCATDVQAHGTVVPPAPVTVDNGQPLTPARHAECATVGPIVYRYLQTGDNQGRPDLDTRYGLLVGVSAPVARGTANEATAECDRNLDAADAERARQQADREWREQEAAKEAAAAARRPISCAEVGGIMVTDKLTGGPYCASPHWQTDGECGSWTGFYADGTVDRRGVDLLPAKCWR